MENENPFKKAQSAQKEEAVEKQEVTQTGRKVIDENTLEDSSWINLPNSEQIGEATPELKILPNGYYNQDGKEMINKKTGDKFYTGLESGKGDEYKKHGEFIIEGLVDGNKSSLRLSNWEVKIKMDALVRYCRDNNYTLANQVISFKRVNEGQKNAGNNWELLCPSLKIKFSGESNSISEL